MEHAIEVTTIKIESKKDGTGIALTLEEAKDLYLQLDSLFGEKNINVVSPIIIERDSWPRRYPYEPIWYWDSSAAPTYGEGKTSAPDSNFSVSFCGNVLENK